MYNELAPKGFRVVEGAINADPDVPGFIQRFMPAFPVGIADSSAAREYMQLPPMERSFVPFMVFIDRKGMIRAQYTGSDQNFFGDKMADNIRAEAEKLLGEPVEVKAKRAAK